MDSTHPCPNAQPLPDHLQTLARILRQPEVTGPELRHCASELEALAARASWATVITTNLRELSHTLSLAVDEVSKLAFTAEDQVDRALELLQGAGESTRWHSPDAQGDYAWDRWEAQALEAGLDKDLAGLGRAVMREAVQHDWDSDLKAECGWLDAGQAMQKLGLRDGEAANKRWRYLLQTDGERGYWTQDGEWLSLRPEGSW